VARRSLRGTLRKHLLATIAFGLAFHPLATGVAEEWERIEPGLRLELPRDHASHPSFETEWWYLTGHLEDEAGAAYGFQFTLFRQGMDGPALEEGMSGLRARHVLAGHLALVGPRSEPIAVAERLRRVGPLARADEERLDLRLENWSLELDVNGKLRLEASDLASGIGLSLELASSKALVAHGEGGYSRKGEEAGNASAYLSWTRLEARGSLGLGTAARPVRGTAWFDHEWGSSQLGADVVGWDWFALQFDDGRELMLYQLRRADGTPAAFSAGTLVDAAGAARHLAREDFEIEVLRSWTSPATAATYPAGWRIVLPKHAIELELQPWLSDCELRTQASTGVTYWEGPVSARGTTSGRGYAELVGYAGSQAGRF
jgi:predicted secreted hydrolase